MYEWKLSLGLFRHLANGRFAWWFLVMDSSIERTLSAWVFRSRGSSGISQRTRLLNTFHTTATVHSETERKAHAASGRPFCLRQALVESALILLEPLPFIEDKGHCVASTGEERFEAVTITQRLIIFIPYYKAYVSRCTTAHLIPLPSRHSWHSNHRDITMTKCPAPSTDRKSVV